MRTSSTLPGRPQCGNILGFGHVTDVLIRMKMAGDAVEGEAMLRETSYGEQVRHCGSIKRLRKRIRDYTAIGEKDLYGDCESSARAQNEYSITKIL